MKNLLFKTNMKHAWQFLRETINTKSGTLFDRNITRRIIIEQICYSYEVLSSQFVMFTHIIIIIYNFQTIFRYR